MHDLSGVGSVGLTQEGSLDEGLFNDFMTAMLEESPGADNLFRAKGVLAIDGRDEKFIFQGVHDTMDLGEATTSWCEGEARVSTLVLIGRGLDADGARAGFRRCLARPLPDGWREAVDLETGRKYFYREGTNETRWTRPTADAA